MLLRQINEKKMADVADRKGDQISVRCAFPGQNLDKTCTLELDMFNPASQEHSDKNNPQSAGEGQLPTSVRPKCLEMADEDGAANNHSSRNGNQASGSSFFPSEKRESCKSQPFNCKQCHLDLSPLKDPFFYIFTWSFLFSQLAYFVPTFHLGARAKTLGINPMDTAYIILVAGKKNLFNLFFLSGLEDLTVYNKLIQHIQK